MNLKLQNSWDYEGNDWWCWSAYLTGRDLDKVKYVEYVLHSSFPEPVRKIKDRSTGFKMETEGWGTFKLKAIVHTIDGKEILLSREIVLKSKPKSGTTE